MGQDKKRTDLLENLKTAALLSYASPTPVPTDTPEPPPTDTPAPTAVPEAEGQSSLVTGLLAACLLGWKPFFKKKLSPIGLICLSALMGMLVYGV